MKENITKDDPDTVARGQALFLKNCADCHGPMAKGQLNFPDVAPNLVEFASQNTENKIAYKIASGKIFHMPDFDNYIGEKEIWDITNYLLYLARQRAH